MKISLDICKLKSYSAYKGSIKVRIKVVCSINQIGQYLVFNTERAHLRKGFYSFLEKHIFRTDYNDTSYLQIYLISETNHLLSEITLFFGRFKSMHHITMESHEGNKYELHYEVKEISQDSKESHMHMQRFNSKSFREEEQEMLNDELGKPQLLRMGILMYNFSQRLDPVVYLYTKIRYILLWKNPSLTLGIGVLLSLVLLNLKISILIGGIVLYACTDAIFKSMERLQKYKNKEKRLMVPEENAFLLQKLMQTYCETYQWLSDFLFRKDKTLLVHAVKIICKMGLILIALLLIFNFDYLLVLSIWTVLLMTSPIKATLKNLARPALVALISEYTKIMDKIAMEIRTMLTISSVKRQNTDDIREFYVFHYQRWNIFTGWQQDSPKFSDKDFQCEAVMQRSTPHGWQWTTNWQLDTSLECDECGYQYSNDFISYFSSTVMLATRRRRKWRRRCVKLKEHRIEL